MIINSKPLHYLPPLFFSTIGYICSIVFYWQLDHFHCAITSLFYISIHIAIFLWSLTQKKRIQSFTVFFMICSAFGYYRTHTIIHSYREFGKSACGETYSIQAMVMSIDYHTGGRFPYSLTLKCTSLSSLKKENSCSFVFQIFFHKKPTVNIGDFVQIEKVLLKTIQPNSFGLYLMKENIAATAFQEFPTITIISSSGSISRTFFDIKKRVFFSFRRTLPKRVFTLFSAIFLGEKETLKSDHYNPDQAFKKWGIVHYLARSGLHLVIIVSLLQVGLQSVPSPFFIKQLLLLIAIIFYYLVTWSSISFIRAFLVFLFYKISLLLRKQTHFLQLLTLCCFCVLLYNPLYLFFLDFQLSFGLTFILAWLNLYKTTYEQTLSR